MNPKFALVLFFTFVGINVAHADMSVTIGFSAQQNPAACQVTTGGKTHIEYGSISRSVLSKTAAYQLTDKPIVALSIDCLNPTSIGLKATDNRSGAIPYGDLTLADGTVLRAEDTNRRFSLGMTADHRPVGVWGLIFNGATVDGNAVGIYGRSAQGLLRADSAMYNDGTVTTWGSGGVLSSGSSFKIGGTVSAAVARLSDLPATEVELDGLVTIEIVYL